MKQLFAITKREFKSYIDHPMAYIIAIVFLVLNSFLYFRSGLAQEVASLRAMFSLLPWMFLFLISALTMRSWAEERKEKTVTTLLSYPVSVWKLVVGKYLATLCLIAILLLITMLIPFSMRSAGQFDWGVIASQYLGALLLASVMVAVGQWVSTLTKNQVVSFILSGAVLAAFFLIGLEITVISLPYPLNTIAQQLGLLSHVNAMSRGVIDLRDVFYFISVTLIFLGLSYVWLIKLKSKASSQSFRKLQTSTVILIAIAVVVNMFGQTFTVRADLTKQNLYSLSPATKTLLRDLDDTVRITLYRSKKLPTQVELVSRDVLDILNDYAKFGGRRVDISVKYPDENEEVAEEAQQRGIPSVQFNVHRDDEFTLQEGHLGVSISYLDEREVLPFISSIDDLEYKLTKAILSMQTDKKLRIGLLSDFGGKSLEELPGFQSAIQEEFTIEQIVLEGEEEDEDFRPSPISDVIDLLFISGPTQPFSQEALAEVQSYVDKGGKILWMLSGVSVDQQTLQASVNETGLESILAQQGVTLNKDIAADLLSHQNVTVGNGLVNYILPYPMWIVGRLAQHQVTGNLAQVSAPWSSTLQLAEENMKPVIITSDATVVQTGSSIQVNPNELPDFSSYEQEGRVLAATVEDLPEGGRWFVLATDKFLDDQTLSQVPANAGLALNALDWLAQNEALLAIRTKDSRPSSLIWPSKQSQTIAVWGNTAGVPVVLIIVGVIWLSRRKRLTKRS